MPSIKTSKIFFYCDRLIEEKGNNYAPIWVLCGDSFGCNFNCKSSDMSLLVLHIWILIQYFFFFAQGLSDWMETIVKHQFLILATDSQTDQVKTLTRSFEHIDVLGFVPCVV